MDKRQRLIVLIFAALLLVALIALVVVVATRESDVIISNFIAPEFDDEAVFGIPGVVDSEDYRTIEIEGNYSFSLFGTPTLEGSDLNVCFASREQNDVWLLIRVYDVKGNEIGQSGLIRAGEYVEVVSLSTIPTEDFVVVKIISYEPDTYFSRGTASATLPITRK